MCLNEAERADAFVGEEGTGIRGFVVCSGIQGQGNEAPGVKEAQPRGGTVGRAGNDDLSQGIPTEWTQYIMILDANSKEQNMVIIESRGIITIE